MAYAIVLRIPWLVVYAFKMKFFFFPFGLKFLTILLAVTLQNNTEKEHLEFLKLES